jgi:hypothetical protein
MRKIPLTVFADAFEARMRSDFYAAWIAEARKSGASEDEIAKGVALEIAEAISLGEGVCPECNEPAVAYYNGDWQQGVSDLEGVWVMFRCSTQPPPGQQRPEGVCDFMLDLKMPLKGAP